MVQAQHDLRDEALHGQGHGSRDAHVSSDGAPFIPLTEVTKHPLNLFMLVVTEHPLFLLIFMHGKVVTPMSVPCDLL